MLLKLKCRKFKKNNIGKNILLILNPNPILGIQITEFQILHCTKGPNKEFKNKWIL